jgi:hypothetical protein
MFCVVTAPIPALAYAHRAATAVDDEATATANRPVEAHRAAIENVISASRRDPRAILGGIPRRVNFAAKISDATGLFSGDRAGGKIVVSFVPVSHDPGPPELPLANKRSETLDLLREHDDVI